MDEVPEQTQPNRPGQVSSPRGFVFKFADGLGPNLEIFNPHLGQVLELAAPAGWKFVGCSDTRDNPWAHSCKASQVSQKNPPQTLKLLSSAWKTPRQSQRKLWEVDRPLMEGREVLC